MTEPLISFAKVSKSYGGRQVLEVESFEVHAGSRVQIVGANGSGKSTLLRLASGISIPSAGRVSRSAAMRGQVVGFVPQDGGVHGELTLRKNARILAASLGAKWDNLDDHMELLEEFHLTSFLDRPVHVLSDGMRRLAAILSVLMASPKILMLDEPLTGVDADFSNKLQALLVSTNCRFEAIVITAHQPHAGFVGWQVSEVSAGRL